MLSYTLLKIAYAQPALSLLPSIPQHSSGYLGAASFRLGADGTLHGPGCDVEACSGSDISGCVDVQVRAHLQNLEKGQKQVCHVFEEWTSSLEPGPVSALPRPFPVLITF